MSGARAAEKETGESSFAARRWRFGPAVLDERSLTLLVSGEPAELERKPLEVLLHLLHHAGEVVTKDELLAAVWPGRVLSDSALTSCMHKLREALRDDTQDIIRTQHGYGYRLVAPVKVEASAAPAAPRFDFKPGDRPPLRPQWSLEKRLGAGGQGEAWLARHDKTREARVFKFAADTGSLSALKREITLSRLLHDALGGRPDLVRVLDWNLEEAPYFIESGYSADGSIADWAAACGGLRQIPLQTRLELAAQLAEALAAAHSVGVLHKDLKPSNVLVDAADGPPRIKLADFGSGGVLDVQRLEQLGITRMGFTGTIAGAASGTPLYLAPEVIAGQPFTLQADIYGLGIVLYQLVAGDFGKPLAQGWERDVTDELLREDIAGATDGHPEQRLADAARLAQRLRGLEERRRVRAAERAAREQADRARLEVERVKARRAWVRLALAASLAGVAASSWLYWQQREAVATTEAVSDFLNNDLLSSADPWKHPIRTMTVKDALDRAAAEVPKRFADRPAVAARLEATIGGIYLRMNEYPDAQAHLASAADLYARLEGAGAEPRLDALQALATAQFEMNQSAQACAGFGELLQHWGERLAPGDARVLAARYGQALCIAERDIPEAGRVLQELLDLGTRAARVDEEFLAKVRTSLAGVFTQSGRLDEAERLQRDVLAYLSGKHGEAHFRTALQRESLAITLDKAGKVAEAGAELERGLADLRAWSGDTSAHTIRFLTYLGNVRIRQNRMADAVAMLEEAVSRTRAAYGDDNEYLTQIPAVLAKAYQRQGRFAEAVQALRPALALSQRRFGPEHRFTIDVGVKLADCLREQGARREAWRVLEDVSKKGLEALPARHYLSGSYRRVEGLLWLADGKRDQARAALTEAVQIYEHALGRDNPATQAVRTELAAVAP